LFKVMNALVLPGWAAIALAPEHEMTPKTVKAIIMSVAVIYIYSLVRGGDVQGASFSSLRGVQNIFRNGSSFVANGCWAHYLAFDLAVGFYISQDAAQAQVPQYLVWPCLLATLMFGPSGYLLYGLVGIFRTGSF